MNDIGAGLTRFEFRSGELRGTALALQPRSLVHRGASHVETLPLSALSAVRVEYERDARRLGWGIALVLGALFLLGISGPLGSLAGQAAQEVAGQSSGVASALVGFFRFVEALAAILPFAAAAAAAGGAALCALGWIGGTTLTVVFAGGERSYRARGRDRLLMDFAERLAESLAALER